MWSDVIIREKGKTKPKIIGRYNDKTNTFETVRDYKKHLLRKQNAWAIDYKLLKEFLLPKNSYIVIIDSHRSTTYKTTATAFYSQGHEIEYLNHRKQMCMNLNLFKKESI